MTVEYLYHCGNDLDNVNAAKVSFSKSSTEFGPAERKLIRFLARGIPEQEWINIIRDLSTNVHAETAVSDIVQGLIGMAKHWTPFSHNSITLRMSAPIPIRTQCFKHKIGFTENEESRRYIKSTPEIFIPDHFRVQQKNVKQGSLGVHEHSEQWKAVYVDSAIQAIKTYEEMIADNVSVEQARFILPQGCIVNWIWTGNLASYARYYNQRVDSHAQQESQDLAKLVGEVIAPLFPESWEALTGK